MTKTKTPVSPLFAATAILPECDYPVAHNLNGTGRLTLLAEYQEAVAALNRFCLVVSQVTLHERDYYPLGPEAFKDAQSTRKAVYALCDEIGTYLDDHVKHLSD
jgi:hypothetical protein